MLTGLSGLGIIWIVLVFQFVFRVFLLRRFACGVQGLGLGAGAFDLLVLGILGGGGLLNVLGLGNTFLVSILLIVGVGVVGYAGGGGCNGGRLLSSGGRVGGGAG